MTTNIFPKTTTKILASDDPTLGMTADDARAIMDAIAASDTDDADALAAYDLLHNRATFGRAF